MTTPLSLTQTNSLMKMRKCPFCEGKFFFIETGGYGTTNMKCESCGAAFRIVSNYHVRLMEEWQPSPNTRPSTDW